MILDGKSLAARLRGELAARVAVLTVQGERPPGLAVVLVGDDPASKIYVRSKERATVAAGMRSFEHLLPADTSEGALLALVEQLNRDDAVDGILVQLPLPPAIDSTPVLSAVDPAKDVDGFHPLNVGRLATGQPALVPCTPRGCMHLLRSLGRPLAGLHAVVVGRSNIVGKPMAQLLLRESCTVTVAHSRTRDLPAVCRAGDIVVAAVGRPRMIGAAHVRQGAIVIDVGINRVADPDGKARLVGDVDYAAVGPIAAAITPVPGGVGPMTIACLLENTLDAYLARTGTKAVLCADDRRPG
jgi:methylenetetrahydrofolate dehydrogenase (NADP+)/methenyltetrahydrofolate cyclohydrolase